MALARFIVILCLAGAGAGADLHVYVGDAGPRHVLIAWGAARGSGNTIGREAASHGQARLQVGEKTVETTRSWARVEGLGPDRSYDYRLSLNGRQVFQGRVRTWAETAQACSFLVIGDYGTGSRSQHELGQAMARLLHQRAGSGRPIRFVLTTGDNIYSRWVIPGLLSAASGDSDSDWGPRFFAPYADLLAAIPFYPVLGNHDGNESEKRADLQVYLDNFFFPGNRPARWYSFPYGGFIEFFALDSTRNTLRGPKAPAWLAGGEQHQWAEKALRGSRAPWKLVSMHHPIFNAGPRHQGEKNYDRMRHFLDLFTASEVQAVFHGHEHNFQVSRADARSGGARYFITGAGGELRGGDVRKAMATNHIQGWAAQRHFLLVDIEGSRMEVTPLGVSEVQVRGAGGSPMPLPIVVENRPGRKE